MTGSASVTSCPECSGETRLEWTENVWNSHVEHVRVCDACNLQYIVEYGRPQVVDVHRFGENDDEVDA